VLGLGTKREHQRLAKFASWVLQLAHGGGRRLGVEEGLERSRLESGVVGVWEHLAFVLRFQSGDWNVLEAWKSGKAINFLERRASSFAIDGVLEVNTAPRHDSSSGEEFERTAQVEVGKENRTGNARHPENTDLPVPHLDLMVEFLEESSHLVFTEEVWLVIAASFLESLFVDLVAVSTTHAPVELNLVLVPYGKAW